jgi:predicted transglutaminase-like cysteine proteinase
LIRTNQNKTVHEKLLLANNTLNKLPWIADKEHWDKVDYWATPLETISTFGGDCEDIAIAKWVMLRYLGVPANKLRLAYVKLKASGENHMILAYVDRIDLPREQREKHTWILDSIDQRLLTAPKRQDLLAVYATDADGNMILITESDNGRVMLGVHEKVKMKKLVELKEKIATNMAFAQKINDGRPLHPD